MESWLKTRIGYWEVRFPAQEFWGSREANLLFGFDPSLPGIPVGRFLEVVAPEQVPSLRDAFEAAVAEGRAIDEILRIRHSENGAVRTIHGRGERVLDENGALVRIVGVAEDVTDLLETERRLEEREARLDPGAFGRIVTNLVSNAVKFTRGGEVTVRLAVDAGDLCLEIADTGVGIDDPFLPYIFDEFRQESEGYARNFEGNGLGLTSRSGSSRRWAPRSG